MKGYQRRLPHNSNIYINRKQKQRETPNPTHNTKMASHHNLSIIFFFAFFVTIISVTAVTGDMVDDVCEKTRNPPLCVKALRADHRSKKADLKGLGIVAIDIATKQAKKGQSLVQSLRKGATDPELKNIYSSCLESYSDSVGILKKCPALLKSKHFSSLNIQASAVLDNPVDCDDHFSDIPNHPRSLKDTSDKLQAFSSIILVISNQLNGV